MLTRMSLLLLFLAGGLADPVVLVSPDVESGIYEPGKAATWTIQIKTGEGLPREGKVSYVVRPGGAGEASKGETDVADGRRRSARRARRPARCSSRCTIRAMGRGRTSSAAAAPSTRPTRSRPPPRRPTTSTSSWKGKIAELAAVPMETVLTPVDVGNPAVEYFRSR